MERRNHAALSRRYIREIQLRVWKLVNVFAMGGLFAAFWWYCGRTNLNIPPQSRGNLLIIALYLFLYVLFGRIYEAFTVYPRRSWVGLYSKALATIISDFIIYLVASLFGKKFASVGLYFALFAGQMLLSLIWQTLGRVLCFRRSKAARSLVVWDVRQGLEEQIKADKLDVSFHILGSLYVLDCLKDLDASLSGIEVLFLYGLHSHERNVIVKYCVAHDIRVYVIPTIGDLLMSGAEPVQMLHLPIMRVERHMPSPEYLFVKRVFDIFVSGIALVLLSPLMAVVSILIRKDGGPVFYTQTRLTQDGRKFEVIKFRSMRVDAESDGVARLSTGSSDDRVTPVGRFIRKVRIDELPQLINVLRGEMTIVGPRPERPEIAAEYEKSLPEFALRLQVKAGLTGYAQVYGKYNTTPYDKLLMDLQYIAHANVIEDLRIMIATVKILLIPESTEGVAAGQTTAMGCGDAADCKESKPQMVVR